MKPVRIFRHVACEGPGYLGDCLSRASIPYQTVCIDEGIAVPPSLDDVSGLIFMGGGMNVTDPLQWIEDEKALIRRAVKQNIPVLGICLGAQLMSTALGGSITHGPGMEIGWHCLQPIAGAENSPWLENLSFPVTAFHWHADTFSIPPGAQNLLRSDCRPNQAFAISNSLALQFHPEMTEDMVREWLALFASDIHAGHPCAQTEDSILEALDKKIANLHKVADCLIQQWLKGIT